MGLKCAQKAWARWNDILHDYEADKDQFVAQVEWKTGAPVNNVRQFRNAVRKYLKAAISEREKTETRYLLLSTLKGEASYNYACWLLQQCGFSIDDSIPLFVTNMGPYTRNSFPKAGNKRKMRVCRNHKGGKTYYYRTVITERGLNLLNRGAHRRLLQKMNVQCYLKYNLEYEQDIDKAFLKQPCIDGISGLEF